MKQTRQEAAFQTFSNDLLLLFEKEGFVLAAAGMKEAFGHPKARGCFEQALNNVLWKEDDRAEQEQAKELSVILEMIPKIADPEDSNTQKIMQMIQEFIDEANQPSETMTQEEIDAELGEELEGEEDNTPLI